MQHVEGRATERTSAYGEESQTPAHSAKKEGSDVKVHKDVGVNEFYRNSSAWDRKNRRQAGCMGEDTYTLPGDSINRLWRHVTCKRCLAKRPTRCKRKEK